MERVPPAPSFSLDAPESVAEQKARLEAERAQQEAAAAKDKLAAAAQEKLQGNAGDLGQGDLLDAPKDLFAPPKPEGRGGSVGMPPIPPGVAAGMHRSVMPVALDRLTPGGIDVPTVMRTIEEAAAAVGSNAPIRRGRFGGNYLGIFRTWADVIRLKSIDDIPTATHELAHAVANQVFESIKSNPMLGKDSKGRPLLSPSASIVRDKAAIRELRAKGKALYGSTKPAAGYTAEGFAEYLREWLSTEEQPKGMPATSKWFDEVFLPNNPKLAPALTKARSAIDTWRGQGAEGRARQQMKHPDGRLKQLAAVARKELSMKAAVEEFAPLEELSTGFKKITGGRLPAHQDPYLLASALRGSAGKILENFVERGVQDVWGNITGPGLKEALFGRVKPEQAQDFANYLWARRAQERWARNQNPGMSPEDAAYLRSKLETPEFVDAATKYYDWWNGVLEYVKQASPEVNGPVVDAIRKGSSDYVPLARVLPESAKRQAQEQLGGGLYKMHGSGLPVKDIYLQSLLVAERLIAKAHRDMVLDSVFRLSRTEGMGWLVERVPRDRVMKTFNFEKVRDKLEQMGVDTSAVPDDALLSFFEFADQPKGTDPIMVRKTASGTEWYQVPAQLFDMLNGLDVPRLGAAADLFLGVPNRAFKMGTTGLRASFSLFTNPARDLLTYFLQSTAGNAPGQLTNYFHGLHDIVKAGLTGKESPAMKTYHQLAVQTGNFLGGDIRQAQREARSLFRGRIFRRVASPMETLREALSFTESTPRFGEMLNVGAELGWKPGQPLTPEQSIAMKLAAKRVTTDFSAGGSTGKFINQAVPFYNATVQGSRAFLRAFQSEQGWKLDNRKTARAVLTGLSMMTVPTLYNWWRNKDKDWYQNLPWRERYLYSNIEAKDGTIVQVPKPQEWGNVFSVLPEIMADSWYRQDPEAARQGLQHIFATSNPLDYPVLLKLAKEQWQNRIDFFDRPIVPRSQVDLPPGAQRTYYTSILANALGDAFPNTVSPRRVDAAIRQVFGGVGSDLMDVPGSLMRQLGIKERTRDVEAADVPVIGRAFRRGGEFSGNSRYLAEFWDQYLTTQSQWRQVQQQRKAGQQPNMDNYLPARQQMLEAYHKVIKVQLEMADRAADADTRRRLYQSASESAKSAVVAANNTKPKEKPTITDALRRAVGQ